MQLHTVVRIIWVLWHASVYKKLRSLITVLLLCPSNVNKVIDMNLYSCGETFVFVPWYQDYFFTAQSYIGNWHNLKRCVIKRILSSDINRISGFAKFET